MRRAARWTVGLAMITVAVIGMSNTTPADDIGTYSYVPYYCGA